MCGLGFRFICCIYRLNFQLHSNICSSREPSSKRGDAHFGCIPEKLIIHLCCGIYFISARTLLVTVAIYIDNSVNFHRMTDCEKHDPLWLKRVIRFVNSRPDRESALNNGTNWKHANQSDTWIGSIAIRTSHSTEFSCWRRAVTSSSPRWQIPGYCMHVLSACTRRRLWLRHNTVIGL